jgi:drug/metabolite transporter (DMT)-like permease
MTVQPIPRRSAVVILLLLGVVFGANHVAARIAFDHGVGITTAVLMRSGLTALVLWALVARQGLRAGVGSLPMGWMLLLGGLISVQSLCLYSAVARIPVALALLVFNTMPALYALLTWALGGRRPSGQSLLCMGLILLGLGLALDVLTGLFSSSALRLGANVGTGVALGFCAASTMACALWITENRLPKVPGAVRSLWAMGLVFVCMLAVGLSGTGLLPGGAAWPRDSIGWAALIALVVLYGSAFSIWFVLMPRLEMARNASFMNIEPVAALVLAWLLLGQTLSAWQLLGVLVVVTGIVLLARLPKLKAA